MGGNSKNVLVKRLLRTGPAVVRLRDKEKLTWGAIGRRLHIDRNNASRLYRRTKSKGVANMKHSAEMIRKQLIRLRPAPGSQPQKIKVHMDEVLATSFRDFHTKGFDYICVKRSERETLKLYFFEGDATKLPEVVNPHDHRYDFDTYILAGSSENVWYEEGDFMGGGSLPHGWQTFNKFAWRTPLNGGDGFEFQHETQLREVVRRRFIASMGHHPNHPYSYYMLAEGLHTIRLVENETVLMLRQYEDVVPLDQCTHTYCRGDAPSLDGLYRKWQPDELHSRFEWLERKTGLSVNIL